MVLCLWLKEIPFCKCCNINELDTNRSYPSTSGATTNAVKRKLHNLELTFTGPCMEMTPPTWLKYSRLNSHWHVTWCHVCTLHNDTLHCHLHVAWYHMMSFIVIYMWHDIIWCLSLSFTCGMMSYWCPLLSFTWDIMSCVPFIMMPFIVIYLGHDVITMPFVIYMGHNVIMISL